MKTIEDLKTFEDACVIEGLDPKDVLPDFSIVNKEMAMSDFAKSVTAYAKLAVIVSAANRIDNDGKEWNPDWDNYDEYKYQPYFVMSSSGFRYHVYDGWNARSVVGSRLCFKSRSVCKYIATQFVDLYKDFLVK